jgi:two-component system OmpR family response regulator
MRMNHFRGAQVTIRAMMNAANSAEVPVPAAAGHVCIVDDDQELRTLLSAYLSRNGMRVGVFADGPSLRRFLARGGVEPDLVVLDLMLPAEDGLSVCRWLKAETDLPVLMLTARGDEIDRVIGLEMGADDYVCKPFSPRELLARIRNLLRLTERRVRQEPPSDSGRLSFHRWTLDTVERRLVSQAGETRRLSGCEFMLLHALATRANRVLSRSQLANLVHGREPEPHDRSIDVLVSRLRQLLGDDARDSQIIRTVYGRGYMLSGQVCRV